MNADAPIGVFDSGVGGLSVARELRSILPAESLLYVADSAYCPYGGRPLEEIRERTLRIGEFLLQRGAKALVVACNSASGAALDALRERTLTPVIGMEPAVKPAAETTRSGRVGVMATPATLQAERFDRLMANYARGIEVIGQACPGLVELVESGAVSGPVVEAVIEPLLDGFRSAGVDTVVLGCTHYPFLRDAIGSLLGPGVVLIDTGAAVARQTARVLSEAGALRESGSGETQVFTTGDARAVSDVVARLWGAPLPVEKIEV